jgi:hypothetical protein
MKYSKIRLWLPVAVFFLTACCLFLANYFLSGPIMINGVPLLRLLAVPTVMLGMKTIPALVLAGPGNKIEENTTQ